MPTRVSPLPLSSTAIRSPRFTLPEVIAPGARFLTMVLTALPVVVVALASEGVTEMVSSLIAAAWYALLPAALYSRRVTLALPAVAAGFLLLTVWTLPFNSAAFIVDFWTSAAMLMLALPRRS